MEIKDVAREAGKIWREMDIEERNKWRNNLDKLQKKYEKENYKNGYLINLQCLDSRGNVGNISSRGLEENKII